MNPPKLITSMALLCAIAQVNAGMMQYNTSNQLIRSDNQTISYSPKGCLASVDDINLIRGAGFIEQSGSMTSTMFGGVRMLSNGVTQSIFTDNHSTLKTASADKVQHSYTDPYGNAVSAPKVKGDSYPLERNRMTYDGGYEINPNLINFNARSYLPAYHVFTSEDSYDVPNRYNFSAGNPVMKFDPSGHNVKDIVQDILLYGFGVDTRSLEGLGISLAIHVVGGLVPLAILAIKTSKASASLALDTAVTFGEGFGEGNGYILVIDEEPSPSKNNNNHYPGNPPDHYQMDGMLETNTMKPIELTKSNKNDLRPPKNNFRNLTKSQNRGITGSKFGANNDGITESRLKNLDKKVRTKIRKARKKARDDIKYANLGEKRPRTNSERWREMDERYKAEESIYDGLSSASDSEISSNSEISNKSFVAESEPIIVQRNSGLSTSSVNNKSLIASNKDSIDSIDSIKSIKSSESWRKESWRTKPHSWRYAE